MEDESYTDHFGRDRNRNSDARPDAVNRSRVDQRRSRSSSRSASTRYDRKRGREEYDDSRGRHTRNRSFSPPSSKRQRPNNYYHDDYNRRSSLGGSGGGGGGGYASRGYQQQYHHRGGGGGGSSYHRSGPSTRGPPIVTGLDPLKTYKQYLLSCDDLIEPDVAKDQYHTYKESYLKRFSELMLQQHLEEEWFQAEYNPLLREEIRVKNIENKDKSAEVFEGDALDGKMNLIENHNAILNSSDTMSDDVLKLGLEQPYYKSLLIEQCIKSDDKFDERYLVEHALYVVSIPSTCSHAEFIDAIHNCDVARNFTSILFSHPTKTPPKGLSYSAYIGYRSKDDANSAKDVLTKLRVKPADEANSFNPRIYKFLARKPIMLAGDFSAPTRVEDDLKQALQLAELLHLQAGLDTYTPTELLKQVIFNEYSLTEKLDVVIQYLRYVHHFEYYLGEEFIDAGDLWLSCPLPPIRGEYINEDVIENSETGDQSKATATTSTTSDVYHNDLSSNNPTSRLSSVWKMELDILIQAFIAKKQKAGTEGNIEDNDYLLKANVVAEKSLDTFLKEFCFPMVQDDGSTPVFRCNVEGCKKRFKAASFVHKHLQTKHSDILKKFEAKDLVGLTSEIYLNDKDKFVPSVEDSLGSSLFTSSFATGGAVSRGPGFVSNHDNSVNRARQYDDRPYANPQRHRDSDSGRHGGGYGRVGNGREVQLDARSSLNKNNNTYHDVDAPKMDDVDLDYGDF